MSREAASGDTAAMMGSRGAPGTWRRVRRAAQEAAAHALLLCFTVLLALKLDGIFSGCWWLLFIPLWLFHAVVARYRFSLPATSLLPPQNCQRIPCHSVVAIPLLIAFELLLCIYLEGINGRGESFLDLKLVFLPLLALEIITLVDNFRMCGALMPENGETITDEDIWERLPHFWVAISMVFLLAATSLMLLKLCGDAVTMGWWDLFINFGISQCFAFLVCTRWSNPMSVYKSILGIAINSSYGQRVQLEQQFCVFSPKRDSDVDKLCRLQDIGGPILIIPIVIFQVLLCMRLEGTPSNARFIPVRAIFSPIFLLQVVAVFFAVWRFFERLVIKLQGGIISEEYISASSKINALCMIVQHGSRFITWTIDENSKEEQAHLCYTNNVGYSTFCSYPPEMVKGMSKKVLVEEVQRLQLALEEQTKKAHLSQQRCDTLKNERILCRICFERDVCIVLLPCRHHVLCEPCFNKCQSCPICRVPIEIKLSVNDAVNSAAPLSEIV
ncbi:LOW QUALITY PROTEIN: uncharacterized protein LOC100822157 [Brachypodium distachyon]|uniref:LOW QUALITY PROTEIN: uncharacterized protein LOC100822157 n=1 Tax=Brachypodium distachyon TaxID=15368 RepID=UPI000D0E3462|nr:LOW QUALITY PROTEIN: uncharacterized protein LOC100822157 [Brachypodium distachyon]|eukprot:XP_024319170.1 LOW QUALITY PROTEIN: uncharacterized protein LOC100822157 [Brachypodium distachyon]